MSAVFRITVRGLTVELRGQYRELGDGDQPSIQEFSEDMAKYGMVIASQTANDFDPWAIDNPENPPSQEASKELIQSWFDTADKDHRDELIEYLAHIHFNQALVIRGERGLRMRLETELRDRELHHFETEQKLDQIKGYVRRHMTDDGWTGDPEDIITFLGEKL